MPFNGDFIDETGNVRNLMSLGDPPEANNKDVMCPFSGDFYASDGSIHNVDELLDAAGGGSGFAPDEQTLRVNINNEIEIAPAVIEAINSKAVVETGAWNPEYRGVDPTTRKTNGTCRPMMFDSWGIYTRIGSLVICTYAISGSLANSSGYLGLIGLPYPHKRYPFIDTSLLISRPRIGFNSVTTRPSIFILDGSYDFVIFGSGSTLATASNQSFADGGFFIYQI